MTAPVVVFDLDGTLTCRDTSVPFLKAVSGTTGRVWTGLLATVAGALPDLARSVVAERFEGGRTLGAVSGRWEGLLHERLTRHVLAGRSRDALDACARRFADRVADEFLRLDARPRLEAHRKQGHRLILASASLEIYLTPLRSVLGLDAVLGTRLEVLDGVATGRFDGLPCWGLEKVRRVQALLGGEEILHVYGDGAGDRPLLNLARHGTLVRAGR